MKLTCSSCQQQIMLDDSKLPSSVFKIKCPKCGKLITGQKDAAPGAAASASPASAASAADELQAAYGAIPASQSVPIVSFGDGTDPGSTSGLIKREVAALRKELQGAIGSLFGHGRHVPNIGGTEGADEDSFGNKALICEDDQAFIDLISTSVRRLGYSIDIARSTAEALKKVDGAAYDLITVDYIFPDDKEGGNKILAKINGQKPAQRRETFVVLISSNVKSSDANAAFFHGANITVNKEEIKNLEPLIRDGKRKFQEIYRVFNRTLEEKHEKL